MYAAVNETAKMFSPLSIAISNGILRSINAVLSVRTSNARKKTIEQLTYMYKLEYPRESNDYVMNMAIQAYEEAYNA